MALTQKQRLKEAYEIHSRFHHWMGYLVCDGEEDMLALRKLVKKIEREAVNEYKKSLPKKKSWLDAGIKFIDDSVK